MMVRLLRMILMALALTGLVLGAIACIPNLEMMSRPLLVRSHLQKADVVVAISAAIIDDCNPHPALLDREAKAAALLKQGYSRSGKVIFSGVYTQGPEVSPRQCHQMLARRFGLSPGQLILENQATSTYENAIHVRKLMQERKWHDAVLVTAASHMKRARWTFKKQQVAVYPVTVPDRLHPGEGFYDIRRLTYFYRFLYEYVALLRYKWYGYI